jgi:hypothetical protein
MGCGSSRASNLETVDDSVHVMLAHDKKLAQKKGQKVTGYVPRASHPLLKPKTPEENAAIAAAEDKKAEENKAPKEE